ncbi:transposase [Pilimelia columellifera]|uniref:transposase n=1 Tax=Pilimelia columellifera TaxID=706574 RepID=UPI003CD085F4
MAHRHGHLRATARSPDHRRRRTGPQRRPTAAVGATRLLPRRPAGLGRLRPHRPTRQLGHHPAQTHHPGRSQTRRADHLRRPTPRWCVERTFSWINRCRRTVRDYERLPQHHAAMTQWAMTIIMTRRLARHRHT